MAELEEARLECDMVVRETWTTKAGSATELGPQDPRRQERRGSQRW